MKWKFPYPIPVIWSQITLCEKMDELKKKCIRTKGHKGDCESYELWDQRNNVPENLGDPK
jgi:hypothetical protein